MIISKLSQQRGSYRVATLLLNAAHLHAEVLSFNHDAHSMIGNQFRQSFGDLDRHPLLNLQPSGKDFDQPSELGKADDFASRQVGDVAFTEEWQQVVLAKTVEFDASDHHHLFRIVVKYRAIHSPPRVFSITTREKRE